MKTLFIALFMAAFASSSFAQSFNANAYVQVTQTGVSAQVTNNSGSPMVCTGKVFGTTYSGHTLFAVMKTVVPAYSYRYAYVYTNMSNPFVNGWSEIWCRY